MIHSCGRWGLRVVMNERSMSPGGGTAVEPGGPLDNKLPTVLLGLPAHHGRGCYVNINSGLIIYAP